MAVAPSAEEIRDWMERGMTLLGVADKYGIAAEKILEILGVPTGNLPTWAGAPGASLLAKVESSPGVDAPRDGVASFAPALSRKTTLLEKEKPMTDESPASDSALPIDREWLLRELVAMNFRPQDVAEHIDHCVMQLRLNGVTRRGHARVVFSDRAATRRLREIYDLHLARPLGQLDPVAVCVWLPKLCASNFNGASDGDMYAAVRDAVLASPEAAENRAVKVRVTINLVTPEPAEESSRAVATAEPTPEEVEPEDA